MITQEIKTKIMYLYYGQNVYLYDREKPHVFDSWPVDETNVNTGVDETLVLKSLSDITDEDAIEVAKRRLGSSLVGAKVYRNDQYTSVIHKTAEFRIGKNVSELERGYVLLVNGTAQTMFVSDALEFADYLRSKGYALPAFGYSVEQLIEAGIFKLKTPTPDGK